MSPRGHRVRWWLIVGVSQISLTVLAAHCIQLTPENDWLFFRARHVARGWPVVWSESVCVMDADWNLHSEQLGPVEHRGSNPVVPALMVSLAICLPPTVAGALVRRLRNPDGSRPRASRMNRSARVVVFAATGGLTAAAMEIQTAFVLSPTPLTFIDRLINTCRSDVVGTDPDGNPVYRRPGYLITGSEWYREAYSRASRIRDRMVGESPDAPRHISWPAVESDWRFRTRLTLASTGLGLLFGCVLFRPWGRAELPAGPVVSYVP